MSARERFRYGGSDHGRLSWRRRRNRYEWALRFNVLLGFALKVSAIHDVGIASCFRTNRQQILVPLLTHQMPPEDAQKCN